MSMAKHTESYVELVNRVALRRRALIRDPSGRLLFPKAGTPWVPDGRSQAACESYIVLFVAELETYLERIVARALSAYMNGYQASFLSQCGAGAKFYETVRARNEDWKKNNNTNWSRISGTLEFVGLQKNKCPENMWDYIEVIAHERGGIVHNSVGARNVNDPRSTIATIDKLLVCIRDFDRDIALWVSRMEAEVARLHADQIRFTSGLGSITF